MRSFLLSLFLFFGSYAFCQGFTIQNNFISISGNSTDSDFYDNTYLDALSNTTINWSIIYDSVPQGWQYSTCFPNCDPIGVTSGAINISQGNDYYLNGHFYPNNVAGEGMYVMEIDDGNGTIEQVTWHGIAGSVGSINNFHNLNKKEIKHMYNLSGQIISEIPNNQIYIVSYSDGSFGKIFIIK